MGLSKFEKIIYDLFYSNHVGHRSIGQFLIHELGCDEKTVVELLSRREDNSVRKFIVLRKNGLEAQNILGGLNTVTRHSVEGLNS